MNLSLCLFGYLILLQIYQWIHENITLRIISGLWKRHFWRVKWIMLSGVMSLISFSSFWNSWSNDWLVISFLQMTSNDKDFRFMATNDLMVELQKDSIKLDDDSERKVHIYLDLFLVPRSRASHSRDLWSYQATDISRITAYHFPFWSTDIFFLIHISSGSENVTETTWRQKWRGAKLGSEMVSTRCAISIRWMFDFLAIL